MGYDKFCAKCGQKTSALINGVCQDCFLQKKQIFTMSKPHFTVCKFCGKFLSHGKWFFFTEESIKDDLIKSVHLDHELEKGKIFAEVKRLSDNDFAALIKVEGFIKDVLISEEKSINFSVKPTTCDACMKLNANYREAVIQIRAPKDEAKGMYEFAIAMLDKERAANSLSGTSKIIESPYGYDLWVGSKAAAVKVSRALSKTYNLKVVTSKKIIGEEGGHCHFKFRFTYCLKMK